MTISKVKVVFSDDLKMIQSELTEQVTLYKIKTYERPKFFCTSVAEITYIALKSQCCYCTVC